MKYLILYRQNELFEFFSATYKQFYILLNNLGITNHVILGKGNLNLL